MQERRRLTEILAAAVALLAGWSAPAGAQTAAPPPAAPYAEHEVTFKNGDVSLAGTLTMPAGPGPFPAVVLLTGSGAQNRDEEIAGFKPFKLLAEHLGRNGIAVLRYDDRGVGGSTGTVPQSTTEDFAGDARAALDLLAARPGIDAARMGLIGHSEGALVAALAATRASRVAFIVLLAGSTVPGSEILRIQNAELVRAAGADPALADKVSAAHKRATEALIAGEPDAVLSERFLALARAQIEATPAADRAMLPPNVDEVIQQQLPRQIAQMKTPWFRYFVTYDPAVALAKVTCPVYAAFGERDLQVPPVSNRPPLEAALAKAGNTTVTVKVYPEANHLFQTAKTGRPNEYATLDKQFVAGLLDDVTSWIRGQPARR